MASEISDIDALCAEEARRCELLVSGASDVLERMLAGDLVHIHLNGQVDDKAGYMAGVREKYRFADVRRGPLNVRVWGDTAVMIGPLSQRITVRETGKEIEVGAITTQTWQRSNDRWLLTTCHNAPVSA
jgi:Domain of unknown function (DUF4440)